MNTAGDVVDAYPENVPDPEGEFALAAPEYMFYLMLQVVRQRDLAFDKLLAPHDLNVACWRTLAIVRRVSGSTMKAVARLSAIDRTTLTRCVDQLVDRGLIKRETPAKDRRKVSLRLTKAGEAIYDKTVLIYMECNRINVLGVDPDKLRHACRTLQAVLGNILAEDDQIADILTFGRGLPPSGKDEAVTGG